MPSLLLLVLVLLLLLMFYISSRVFTGVITDVTNVCAKATRDGGTTGTSCPFLFFFSSYLLLALLSGYLLFFAKISNRQAGAGPVRTDAGGEPSAFLCVHNFR